MRQRAVIQPRYAVRLERRLTSFSRTIAPPIRRQGAPHNRPMKSASSANHKTEIMTVSDLTDYLGCSQGMIYKLLKRKQIPAFRLTSGLGSDWRFFRSAIDEWIEQHEMTNLPATKGRKPKVS
jgi:excisionase family DNA binding protein